MSATDEEVDIQIVGGGRMGEALLAGLLAADPGRQVRVVEALAARADELRTAHPSVDVSDAPGPSAGTVLAVKPHQIVDVCAAVAAAGGGRVLSIAAGVTIASIEAALPAGTPVVRAMPNTPALVGQGAAAIAGGSAATDADVGWAEGVLSAVGAVTRVPEHLLDAVTGLSGSGPAYVFVVLDALIEGGVAAGLARHRRGARRPDAARRRQPLPRRRQVARRTARPGHVAGRHHRRRAAGPGTARSARCAHRRRARRSRPLRRAGLTTPAPSTTRATRGASGHNRHGAVPSRLELSLIHI